jgi:hypothetical protein
LKYREAINKAILEWEKGGIFRSKSRESQNAVDALKVAMRSDPLDGPLAEIVEWLIGTSRITPASCFALDPIKAKSKLRTLLDAAVIEGDPPVLRAKKPHISVSSSSSSGAQRRTQVSPTLVPSSSGSSSSNNNNSNKGGSSSSSSSTTVIPKTTIIQPSQIRIQPSSSRIIVQQPPVIVIPTPQVSKHLRHLIMDCCERSGGNVDSHWSQASVFASLAIPEDTYNGFCASAVGRWFDGEGNAEKLKTQKGKIDTLNIHSRYRGSGKSSYEFLTEQFKLPFLGVTPTAALTPENMLKQLETDKGTRHMVGLLKSGGGGHAIGVWRKDSAYKFSIRTKGSCRCRIGRRSGRFSGITLRTRIRGWRKTSRPASSPPGNRNDHTTSLRCTHDPRPWRRARGADRAAAHGGVAGRASPGG